MTNAWERAGWVPPLLIQRRLDLPRSTDSYPAALVNKSPSERHFDYLNNTYSSETLNETLALPQSPAAEPVAANGTLAAGSEIDLSG